MVCLLAWSGEPDRFFAIAGALSWVVTDAPSREILIRAARPCGFAMVRERLSWAAVHPDRQRRHWQGPSGYETIRGLYRESKVPILEMAHDSPPWLGMVGKYPRDDLVPSPANTLDPNGKLDLERVRRTSVSMNHSVTHNTLEISDLYVLTPRAVPRAGKAVGGWMLFCEWVVLIESSSRTFLPAVSKYNEMKSAAVSRLDCWKGKSLSCACPGNSGGSPELTCFCIRPSC